MRAGLLALGLALVVPARAGVLDEIGYTRLHAELGERMPCGAGLRLMQVESPLAVDHDGDPATAKVHTWMVAAHDDLPVPVVDHSDAPAGAYSRHATTVARRLAGSKFGLARGLAAIDLYSVNDWFGSVLRAGTLSVPAATAARVGNHSWAASLDKPGRGGLDANVLRRVDWLAERDEFITVAGVRNRARATNAALLAAAHNAIVVGRADGKHSRGTAALDRLYTAGRARPHLVAPANSASAAAPTVAAAALLLTEAATDPSLSTRREPRVTRAGLRVYDAGRAETVRAILMATARPIMREDLVPDERYGAGLLDLDAAWRLLAAGERERTALELPASGFDFVTGLAAHAVASYDLRLEGACLLRATLSWHVYFPGLEKPRFDASAELRNLDLELIALLPGGERTVARSASLDDTTESVHETLTPGAYRLEVRSRATRAQDYALAWRCVRDYGDE